MGIWGKIVFEIEVRAAARSSRSIEEIGRAYVQRLSTPDLIIPVKIELSDTLLVSADPQPGRRRSPSYFYGAIRRDRDGEVELYGVISLNLLYRYYFMFWISGAAAISTISALGGAWKFASSLFGAGPDYDMLTLSLGAIAVFGAMFLTLRGLAYLNYLAVRGQRAYFIDAFEQHPKRP
ncbi:MAG: hypothetical protein JSR60_14175 [Proteobacteria bacterium]|nr:hypothetical protein [Pseudomonadota bacterium]